MMYVNLTTDDGELLDRTRVTAAELAADSAEHPHGILAQLMTGSEADNEGHAVPAREHSDLPSVTGYVDADNDRLGNPRYSVPQPIWDGMLSSIRTNRALGTTGARFQADHEGVRYTMAATRRRALTRAQAVYDFVLAGRMLTHPQQLAPDTTDPEVWG